MVSRGDGVKLRNSISINVLAQYLRDPGRMPDVLSRIGGVPLVMDSWGQAIQLADRGLTVVHRFWTEQDKEYFLRIPADKFVVGYRYLDRVFNQVMNEPVVTRENVQQFVDWNVTVMQRAKAAGAQVAVGTFAVGNPHESLIMDGSFDAFIREIDSKDTILMVHEYFHTSPSLETPWLIGRIEFWLERAREIGHPIRRIIVGETGRDVGGGRQDGWRGVGLSAKQYRDRLAEVMSIYDRISREYGVEINACVFCAGVGGGNMWESFDIENVGGLYDWMAEYNRNALVIEVEDEVSHNWGQKRELIATAVEGGRVNIRPEPNTSQPPVGSMTVGWRGMVYDNGLQSGGHQWRQIEHGGGLAYVAGQYITFEEPAPVEPVPLPPVGLFIPGASLDELQQLAELHTGLSDQNTSIAEVYNRWIQAIIRGQ